MDVVALGLAKADAAKKFMPAPERPVALSTAVALGATFDKQWGVYNLKAKHLRTYRAGLGRALAGTGLCRIGFAADSIAAGRLINTPQSQSWPVRLREFLVAAGYPRGGTGMAYCWRGDLGLDPRFTAVGTWAQAVTSAHGVRPATAATGTLTFTSDLPGTVVEVMWSPAVVGTDAFTVTIDGGTAQGPYVVDNTQSLRVTTITGLANTTHTVVITPTVGRPFIYGVGVRQTSGVLVDNAGASGSKASEWNGAFYTYQGGTSILAPDLVFVALGTNDLAAAADANSYAASVQAVAAKFPNSSVVLVAQIPGQNLDWSAYRAKLFGLATSLDLPLLDLHDRWLDYNSANARGLMADGWHPNAVGAADIALAARNIAL